MKTTNNRATISIPEGVFPQDHEIETVRFFAKRGYIVEFLVHSRERGRKTPDIRMQGLLWEIKRPKGRGKYTIQHAFKSAARQSENIIFDLQMFPRPQEKAVQKLEREFTHSLRVRRPLIIISTGGID